MTDFVSGDTGSKLRLTITDKDSGAAINLTGATVTLRWKNSSGTLVSRTMTVVTAASGICEYQFAAGELFAPKMRLEAEVVDSGGKIVTGLDLIELAVREQLG